MITCEFEDGGKAKLRHATVNGIIIKNNKVLLGKRGTHQGKTMLEAGKWGLIGGFVGRDENLVEALKREAVEETGCVLEKVTLFRIKDNPDRPAEDRQNIEFVFIAETQTDPVISDEEVRDLQWFSLDSLPPKDTIAFDHGDDIELYKKYSSEVFSLPFTGWNK